MIVWIGAIPENNIPFMDIRDIGGDGMRSFFELQFFGIQTFEHRSGISRHF